MKIKFYCLFCASEHGLGTESEVYLTPMESGLYDVRCSKGHSTLSVLQQMRFEVLFEIGVNAISDGYFREAISSFAAALERFLEFYILLVFKERGIEENLHNDAWKLVSSQSERQLGAYLFLYAIHENEQPLYLDKPFVELRNQVVHKGRLPHRDEAIRFGNAVLGIINPIVRRLKERSPDLLLDAVRRHQRDAASNAKEPITHGNCVNTTISLAYALSVPDCHDISNLPQIKGGI